MTDHALDAEAVDAEAVRAWIKRMTQELAALPEDQREAALEKMREHLAEERRKRRLAKFRGLQ